MHFLGTVIGPESESEVNWSVWSENAYVVEYREDILERAHRRVARRHRGVRPRQLRGGVGQPARRLRGLREGLVRGLPRPNGRIASPFGKENGLLNAAYDGTEPLERFAPRAAREAADAGYPVVRVWYRPDLEDGPHGWMLAVAG